MNSKNRPSHSTFDSIASTTLKVVAVAAAANWGIRTFLRSRRKITLENKVIMITGASSGHGLILAKHAARDGAILVLAARSEDDLKLVREELLYNGARDVLIIPTDIRDYSQVKELVAKTVQTFGRIDVLVNNAGIMGVGPAETMSLEDFDDCLTSNFWGALYTTTEVLPYMKQRKFGRIANVVSFGGKRAVPHMLPYTVSKFALAGFTEGLGEELSKQNIFVTGVYPSPMRTGGHTNAWFRGNKNAEYSWFGAFANLPLLSTCPHSAAKGLWKAVCNGDPELVIGWPSKFALALQSIFPGLMNEAMALANRVLPDAGTEDEQGSGYPIAGKDLQGTIPSMLNKAVPEDARPHSIDIEKLH